MDFERITQVYREETGKKSQTKLAELEPDFYDLAKEYIGRLEREATKATSENPTSSKAHFLQDELRKARKRLEQIFEYRGRKIAILAHSKVSGADVDLKGLTTQEIALFERLTAVLSEGRRVVFGGGEGQPKPQQSPAKQIQVEGPKGDAEAPAQSEKIAPSQRKTVTIYITEDVPPFAGIDATYKLKKEDVVSLPQEYGDVLVKRGKARYIDVR